MFDPVAQLVEQRTFKPNATRASSVAFSVTRYRLGASLPKLSQVLPADTSRSEWESHGLSHGGRNRRRAIDYALAGASTALILADWSQTLQIIRKPGAHREGNPLLGCHPSEGHVNTMIGLAVTANLAALLLPKRPRRMWYAAVILIEGIAVTHNLTNGLSIGF